MQAKEQEIWKPIPDYEEDYAISNFGRVKRIRDHPCGVKARILKCSKMKIGYTTIFLYKNGVGTPKYVHRLVLEAFDSVNTSMVVNHKDGIKNNNHIDNLEYVTYGENHLHAYKNELRLGVGRKLKENDIFEILELWPNMSYNKIAKKYNVSIGTIAQIFHGKTWKNAVARFKEKKSADVFMGVEKLAASGDSSASSDSSVTSSIVEKSSATTTKSKRRAF